MLIKDTPLPAVGLLRPPLSHRRICLCSHVGVQEAPKKRCKTRRYSERTRCIGLKRIQAVVHFLPVGGKSGWMVLEQVGRGVFSPSR